MSDPLNKGEVAAIEAVKRAIAKRGENDAVVQWALERLVAIANGERRGRYIGDEYRAIVQLLDRIEGKPKERQEHTGEVKHRVVIEETGEGAG